MLSRTPLRPSIPRLAPLRATIADISAKKQQLFKAIAPLNRGISADDEHKKMIDSLCMELEEMNPTAAPLESDGINGRWELIYTTSNAVLRTTRSPLLRPGGPIYQSIDTKELKSKNHETWPWFIEASANLTPLSKSKLKVKFHTIDFLGIFSMKAPPTSQGTLDTTFLDDDLRISRGNTGNLFVLTMNDPNGKP